MAPNRVVERLRRLDVWQWFAIAAIAAVVVFVIVLVAPALAPKPAPTPQLVPSATAKSTAAAPRSTAAPAEVRTKVLAALGSDGITVPNPDAVKISFEGDKSHVTVYGEFATSSTGFKSYRYVLKNGEWQRQ